MRQENWLTSDKGKTKMRSWRCTRIFRAIFFVEKGSCTSNREAEFGIADKVAGFEITNDVAGFEIANDVAGFAIADDDTGFGMADDVEEGEDLVKQFSSCQEREKRGTKTIKTL